MKYRCVVYINLPLKRVVELWDNENNFKEWQDGFQRIERISGEINKEGSKAQILFHQGKQKIELIETILANNLPKERTALYEHIHMDNTQTTKFVSINENQTQYISEVEYVKFKSFLPKLMAKLFPRMFKKQSQKWMNQFKEFAEKQGA